MQCVYIYTNTIYSYILKVGKEGANLRWIYNIEKK